MAGSASARSRSLPLLVWLSLAASALGDLQPCVYKDAATGASFDLTPLRMGASSSYAVKDVYDSVERNYTYVFNVCNDANVPGDECQGTEAGAGPAPAFQVFQDGGCTRLGASYEDVSYSLLDAMDPTQGVQMTYLNGDTCHLKTDVQREMTVKFKCSESWGKVPDARVTESNCHYELMFETIYGCPMECPFAKRKMCGGNGFCGMDLDFGGPRCFCNDGFGGKDCQAPKDPPALCDGTCGLLIFVILLLGGLLAVGIVIFIRVHKLSLLNVQFGEMSEQLNHPSESMSLNAGNMPSDRM